MVVDEATYFDFVYGELALYTAKTHCDTTTIDEHKNHMRVRPATVNSNSQQGWSRSWAEVAWFLCS